MKRFLICLFKSGSLQLTLSAKAYAVRVYNLASRYSTYISLKILSILFLFLMSASCLSSQSYGNRLTYNVFKGGVWGNWSNTSYTGNDFRFQYDKTSYILISYNDSEHPSSCEYRIEIIDNHPKKSSDGSYEYQGKIFCSTSVEYYDNMLEYYTIKKEYKAPFEAGYEKYFVFQCTVKTNKKIYDLVKKGKGTINVFYNGVGRAWSFNKSKQYGKYEILYTIR